MEISRTETSRRYGRFHGVLYASYTVAGYTSTGSAESWTFNSNGSITTSNGSAVTGSRVTIYGDYGTLDDGE